MKKKILTYFFIICAVITAGITVKIALNNKKPNIILITLDALRPDHLSCYGYSRNTSPNIDRLAKEGALFTQAISQASYTLGSVPSFFTSAYPYVHPKHFKNHLVVYLNPKFLSLTNILENNGYETAMITDHSSVMNCIIGLKDNFRNYISLGDDMPKQLTHRAVQWLNEHKDKRFFLWLYYMSPHAPYRPSLPYSEKFYKDNLSKTNKQIPILNMEKMNPHGYFGGIPDYVAEKGITDVDYYISKYDGKIRVADDQIGLLVRELKKLGLYKNTLIIIISDHGESLGEHNLYFNHSLSLYNELLRVPLIMWYPRSILQNTVINRQVALLDLMPTIMDFAGIRSIKRKYENIKGNSLMPCIYSKKKCDRQYVFSNNTEWIFSIRTPSWKLIRIKRDLIKRYTPLLRRVGDHYKVELELYNLKNDPLEKNNLLEKQKLSGKEKKIFKDLKQRLDKYINHQIYYYRSVYPKYSVGLDRKIKHLDNTTEEKLRSLGYAQ